MKKEQKRISKRMKELRGKLRKKAEGGNCYYRLTSLTVFARNLL